MSCLDKNHVIMNDLTIILVFKKSYMLKNENTLLVEIFQTSFEDNNGLLCQFFINSL